MSRWSEAPSLQLSRPSSWYGASRAANYVLADEDQQDMISHERWGECEPIFLDFYNQYHVNMGDKKTAISHMVKYIHQTVSGGKQRAELMEHAITNVVQRMFAMTVKGLEGVDYPLERRFHLELYDTIARYPPPRLCASAALF